jgi:hypothetical protein
MSDDLKDLNERSSLNSTDTAEEDSPSGGSSQYVTRRDLRVALIGLAGLIFVMTPVYLYYREETRASNCRANLSAIYKAISLYAAENNDALPPAYMRKPDGTPVLENGRQFTWAALVQPYMTPRRSFRCETASPTEVSTVAHAGGLTQSIQLTYGLYAGLELVPLDYIDAQNTSVLIAETSEDGFNPKPLEGGNDTFLIGYDNGNLLDRVSLKQSARVTRLAFSGDLESGKAEGRHHKGTQAISASGRLMILQPTATRIDRDSEGKIIGRWAIPPRREAEVLYGP